MINWIADTVGISVGIASGLFSSTPPAMVSSFQEFRFHLGERYTPHYCFFTLLIIVATSIDQFMIEMLMKLSSAGH